jgi:hypothetical protein
MLCQCKISISSILEKGISKQFGLFYIGERSCDFFEAGLFWIIFIIEKKFLFFIYVVKGNCET